jgi:hypothetical protein
MYRARVVAAILAVAAMICIFWPSGQHKPAAAVTAVYITPAWHGEPAFPAATRQPDYTIRPGNTLAGVALRNCPAPADWTGLYAANRHELGANPDVIPSGVTIVLDCYNVPAVAALAARDEPRPPAAPASTSAGPRAPPAATAAYVSSGTYSYAGLEQLWISAGGPPAAAPRAATIAICESGGSPGNYYGKSEGVPYAGDSVQASGLWQILGQVIPGDIFNPYINALNAVAKFTASGRTFAAWVCQ